MVDCKEIQKMMVAFHNRELSIEEEELFLTHIEQCSDCREELEIYYIIEYGLEDDAQMPEDEEEIGYIERFDFKGLVELKITESSKRVDNYKLYNKFMMGFAFVADICMIITIIYWIVLQL